MSTATSPATWSYRPGDWLAIFGTATTLLLPASEKARAAQLWDQVDGGAGFAETLDQVLAPGLSVLPAFVLIGTGDGPTKVIVRGAGVRATLTTGSETVELDGSTVTTWVEKTLEDVSAIGVEVGEAGRPGPDYLIDGGLVRVARIDFPSRTADESPAIPAPAPVAASLDAPEAPVIPEAPVAPEVPVAPEGDAVVPEEQPATELLDVAAYDAEVDAAETETEGEGAEQYDEQPAGLSILEDPPADEADGSQFVWDDEDGAEASLPPLPPPPVPVPPAPALGGPPAGATVPPVSAPPLTDHDGLTQTGPATGEFAREKPGIPGQPPAPHVTRPVARLVVSSGDTVEVDRVVLIGRAPEARRFTATEQPRLVTVPSPLHEISSTHVEVRPGTGADHGSAVVTDMGSTNGTVLVQPGLGPEDLKPGIAVQLIPGAIINLGDGVTIQVTNP
ncbi:FHA domain-containing protein [Nocardioides sp. 503]|uniref:FHA domain-containing protein n=1 Tax=Nocardioides sp. 503 TaxID=2508326 RepID=UPI00106F5119|nr:FHA domain-containing protein [Nocardioides sp. 503]